VIVYVARHGETDWNREARYQGRRESNLTPLGVQQAGALATALAHESIERIIASPLRRCVGTAWPLSQRVRVAVETDPRVVEISHGDWEGRLRDDIAREDQQTFQQWQSQPQQVRFRQGESLADVQRRWRAFGAALVAEEGVCVVTHDVLVRVAILDATGRGLEQFWEPRVVNGGYARFAVEGGTWQLLDECVDAHLAGMLVDASSQAL
jgi:probable phosphoglycerate mutase